MPRISNTCQFLAGFITGKMSELQGSLDVLASQAEMSASEMHNMRARIDLVDATVRQQHRDISDPHLRPKLTMYEAVLQLALNELERRERHRGQMPPESDAMRARRLRSDDDLAAYASDGAEPVPLEYWSLVTAVPRRVPISAAYLRHALEDRRTGRDRASDWVPLAERQRRNDEEADRHLQNAAIRHEPPIDNNVAGPSGVQSVRPTGRAMSPSQMDTDSGSASTDGERTRDISPVSYRSRSSINSYVSTRQPICSDVQRNIPLPPVLPSCPFEMDRRNPDLIDRSEFYVRRAGSVQGCPMCGGDHRMHCCPTFGRLRLLERWYEALNRGVCLNCLRIGHSSFMCQKPGACNRCGQRHNSMLCKRHPEHHQRRFRRN